MSDNDSDRETDTQKSLREKILAIPPSGLMIDGKINVAECQDIFDHLEQKGFKSCEEKITYLKEMMSTSGDKYLNEVGVTLDNLNQVVHCVEHSHELLKSAQLSKRTLQDIANIRSNIPASLRSAAERLERDRGIISATGTTLQEASSIFGKQTDIKIKPDISALGSITSPEEGEWKRHKQVMGLYNQELDTLKDVYGLLAVDATTNQDMRRLTWAILAVTSLGVVVALSQRFLPEVVIVILIAVVILTWICLVTLVLIKKRRSAQASVEENVT